MIEDDEFAIGKLMANRHFGNDPFQPDPPTRLNLHSPRSPRTKKTAAH